VPRSWNQERDVSSWQPPLPAPRGEFSDDLIATLRRAAGPAPHLTLIADRVIADVESVLDDEDVQLSLTVLYELHYRGWAAVDERWEWQPDLMAVAAQVEGPLEAQLRDLVAPHLPGGAVEPEQVPAVLDALADLEWGPSLSTYLAREASRQEWEEFLLHRSIYHLREADPHSWAIPRLAGAAKVALVEIQSDEYGGGRPDWMHATLFAQTMRGLGLVDAYGSHFGDVPAVTLTWANTMSLFGLHRRLRGAAAGHLAALEMTSSLPNKRYANGLRRLGLDPATTLFFDEHVEADAVHEQIASHDLAGRLACEDPALIEDILFGAAAALVTDARVATHLLDCWARGATSLRTAGDVLATIAG
jgi:hypothetical protein